MEEEQVTRAGGRLPARASAEPPRRVSDAVLAVLRRGAARPGAVTASVLTAPIAGALRGATHRVAAERTPTRPPQGARPPRNPHR